MKNKIRVAVIFGGRSGEHEVSVVSGTNIIESLDRNKYDVIPIGITKLGKWLAGEKAPEAFKKGDYSDLTQVTLNSESGKNELLHFKNGHVERMKVDIFFPALHGPFGEDGTIQGLFEIANVPYTGCGVLASSVGMDKLVTKALWDQAGLPIVPYIGINKSSWKKSPKKIIKKILDELGMPVFIKPANMGSSVGISKVKKESELKRAIDLACEFDTRILIEKGLNVRELECAVLGNDSPKAARVGEVLVGGEFYDYNDKYVNGVSKTRVPAEITPTLEKEVQKMALKAYKLLDASGLARVDMFLEKNTGKIYINEINTLPGFTSISMYPKMWNASGVTYKKLIDKIIELGFERYREKQQKKISFDEAGDWYAK
ncbi:D-alanine--D-alanine ligase [Candidatus Peregrinibacteria bacterium]|nr:D-alanine--D-alanine ligase [Candidatus Peregrinibacteria bacterium]